MRVAAALVVLAWSATASAQVAPPAPEAIAIGDWKLTPVAEERVRGEYRHDLDGQDRGTLVQRVRLGADVERGPVEMRIVLQDARLWALGAGQQGVGQPAPLASSGAYEGWIEAHTAGASPSFVRVGRQAVTWGEGRLLGAADGSPTGRALDAARARLTVGPWSFEALGASLSDSLTATAGVAPAYGELAGARAQWGLDPLFAVEVYGLARFAQLEPDASLEDTVRGETYTGAARLHGEGKGWSWGAEGAGQLGRVSTLAVDRQAWAAAGHVGYRFEHAVMEPSARLGVAYASGYRSGGGGKYTAFDPILPDVGVWHGAMDVFAWSNEEEASARAALSPWTDAVAAVEYRYARLAEASGTWRSDYLVTIAAPSAGAGAELGHELDASLRWSPWVPLELAAGYSALVLGSGARALLQAEGLSVPDVAHFAFGQATVRLP